MNSISIGFSIHRPEMIPITEKIIEQHDVVYLEEAPDSHFKKMLNGTLEVDDYLMPMDLEYPEFSRAMCHLKRKLYRKGKQLVQTDPFVEALLLIHELFARSLICGPNKSYLWILGRNPVLKEHTSQLIPVNHEKMIDSPVD